MIKTLYANGDSWTFGQELRDDENDSETYKFYNSYPWLLAQKLQIPQVVNDALGGASNYRIFRKTIEYIQNFKGNYNELLVVVAWTTYERREIAINVPLEADNGYSEWEINDPWYFPILMNTVPSVKTSDAMINKGLELRHKSYALLDDNRVLAKKFYNQQWLLKQTCASLGINLLQMYALDNAEFAVGWDHVRTDWLENINPYPISLNRMLMEVEHLEPVRAPMRHPNELGHKYIADRLHKDFKNYTNWSIECPY
jgi:hypothetical protein